MHENEISRIIVDTALKVHVALGPGLLEHVYETALAYELVRRGLQVTRQLPIKIRYENIEFDEGFRADLLVEDKVLVEIKSIERLAPVHKKVVLTYLRLSGRRLGLLINFNVEKIKDGISRIANGLTED